MNEPTRVIRVLVLHPDGTWHERYLEARPERALLAALQDLVGGWVEAIGDSEWVAYCDEEGKIKDPPRPPNPGATFLAGALGWRWQAGDYLAGTVVFLGRQGEHEATVPGRVTATWAELVRNWEGEAARPRRIGTDHPTDTCPRPAPGEASRG
jgi:hypothetical protein